MFLKTTTESKYLDWNTLSHDSTYVKRWRNQKNYLISDDNKGLVIFEKTADELTTFDI